MQILFSRRWPWLRFCARPMALGIYDLLFGADLARRLDLRIEWPGPTLSSATASKWKPLVASVSEARGWVMRRVTELIEKFASVFLPPDSESAEVPFKHVIRVEEGARPFRAAPYRMTSEQLVELRGEIESYLEKGWIRLSQSP